MNKRKEIESKLNNVYEFCELDNSFKEELNFKKVEFPLHKISRLAFAMVLILFVVFGSVIYIGDNNIDKIVHSNTHLSNEDDLEYVTTTIIGYDDNSYLKIYYALIIDEQTDTLKKYYFYEVYGLSSFDDSFDVQFNDVNKSVSPINKRGEIGYLEGELTITINFYGDIKVYSTALN